MNNDRFRFQSNLVKQGKYWYISVRVYDREGEVETKQYKRTTGLKVRGTPKKKAREKIPGIEEQIFREHYSNFSWYSDNPLFSEYVNAWLEEKAGTVRDKTLNDYIQYAKNHILPELGDIEVRKLTLRKIQNYYTQKGETLKSESLKRQRVVIMGALDKAVIDGIIGINPCRAGKIVFPRSEKFEGQAYTLEQTAVLIKGAAERGEPMMAAVMLACVYGLRREEIVGLRWQDVDFEKREVHIRNTVVVFEGQLIEAEQTKTRKSRRDISMPESTVSYFEKLKQQQAARFQLDKVVRWPNGKVVSPDYLSSNIKKLMVSCGLPPIRLHDLRHTAASLLATEVSPKQVQEMLGHENVSTTLEIYTHANKKERDETARKMDALLKKAEICY
ncbi:MAG: site-specific integrase [Oscillospiraceae bacterium]|nr:site-specific integrase [Oscillospiraceae bacterium]